MTGKNRIMIYGPKNDRTYIVEFRTAEGEALVISDPQGPSVLINAGIGQNVHPSSTQSAFADRALRNIRRRTATPA
jgi:hypothetical protein